MRCLTSLLTLMTCVGAATPATRPAGPSQLLVEARATTRAIEDPAPIVRLVVKDPANPSLMRLINGTTRPIRFSGYVDQVGVAMGSTVLDAGNKVWIAIHGIEMFADGKWTSEPAGWCGTGAGLITVLPGKSAELRMLAAPRGPGVWRATLGWGYSDPDTRGHSVAHTEPKETSAN